MMVKKLGIVILIMTIKDFFEFVAKYANESEQQVKPMLEQMQNSIVWTDNTSQ